MVEKTESNENKLAKTTRQKRVKTEKETKIEPVEEKSLTRAEKVKRQKDVIKEILSIRDYKWNELLDAATKLYADRHADEQNENNDLKGRIGSAFDLLEKEGKAKFDKPTGMCSWTEEKPAEAKIGPKKRGRKKAESKVEEVKETKTAAQEAMPVESVPVYVESAEKLVKRGRGAKKETLDEPAEANLEPKKRGRKKAEPKKEEIKTEEVKTEEVKEPKKTAKKVAPVESALAPVELAENHGEKIEEAETDEAKKAVASEKSEKVETFEKAESAGNVEKEEKNVPVFDLSLLLGGKTDKKTQVQREEKPVAVNREQKSESLQAKTTIRGDGKQEPKKTVLPEFAFLGNAGVKARESASAPVQVPAQIENREEKSVKTEAKAEIKAETKKAEVSAPTREEKAELLPELKSTPKVAVKAENRSTSSQSTGKGRNQRGGQNGGSSPRSSAPKTEEEKLKDAFLKRLRTLGGEYFEYYSVYLLERYSLKNGRRLEGLKISGGDTDGGIDGEIVLTDKFGFRETIYIQCKNWDPSKGDAEKWVVGETLLQQFIGAVACRQAREGKRKARGIFVTTSYFTDGAREIFDSMSADFIGYDGNDVFETAKECGFGIVQKDGKWTLDEKLLAGGKAFFELM